MLGRCYRLDPNLGRAEGQPQERVVVDPEPLAEFRRQRDLATRRGPHRRRQCVIPSHQSSPGRSSG